MFYIFNIFISLLLLWPSSIMNTPINILQWNVRGIIHDDKNDGPKLKCINQIIKQHHINVILLQEWSAIHRYALHKNDQIVTTNNKSTKLHFPIERFNGFDVCFCDSNVAILYQTNLDVVVYQPPHQHRPSYEQEKIHYQYVTISINNKEYNICSFYNGQKADAADIFSINFPSNNTIIAGDLNLHHPLWGSSGSSGKSTDFADYLIQSEYTIHQNLIPTHYNKRNGKYSHIDVVLMQNVDITNHQVLHHIQHSDHFPIIYTLNAPLSATEPVPTWNLNSKNWHIYR